MKATDLFNYRKEEFETIESFSKRVYETAKRYRTGRKPCAIYKIMEEKLAGWQRVAKMKELGIYDKWVTNTDARTQEFYEGCYTQDIIDSEKIKRRNRKLNGVGYLSDMIEGSFVFTDSPEGWKYWDNIVDELRSEI